MSGIRLSEEVLDRLAEAGLLAQKGYDVALTSQGVDWARGLDLLADGQPAVGPVVMAADLLLFLHSQNKTLTQDTGYEWKDASRLFGSRAIPGLDLCHVALIANDPHQQSEHGQGTACGFFPRK